MAYGLSPKQPGCDPTACQNVASKEFCTFIKDSSAYILDGVQFYVVVNVKYFVKIFMTVWMA